MSPPLLDPIYRLAQAWRAATRSSRFRAALALVALSWIVALLIAREGTWRARATAAAAIAASAIGAVGWRMAERRRLREPRRIVRALAYGVDREHADRALRALAFVGAGGELRADMAAVGASPELARLHITRALALLPTERIVAQAAGSAARLRWAALFAGVALLAVAAANFWSLIEGADVLFASRGVAPMSMHWLGDVEVVARPPDYLHDGEQHDDGFSPLQLPYGTLVTVRGVPLRPGRALLLSNGSTEIPFVDDGTGALVARWQLVESTTLRVIARFGSVAVAEPEALALRSIPDERPVVSLEGAPRQVSLVAPGTDDISIKYEATDDHGLREVHLVLRSGTREERRALAHLDGETRRDKGGYVLKVRDPFLRKSHAPIEVSVEAEDNDPLTGPKWGASAAIMLIPPEVGEAEARRLDALRGVRDALVDSLAWRLSNAPPADAPGKNAFAAEEKRRTADDESRLDETLTQTYAGTRVPARLRAMLLVQQQKTRKAIDAEVSAPSATTHAAAVAATERFVLVVDAIVRGLGIRDTREAAKELADVADDLARAAGTSSGSTTPPSADVPSGSTTPPSSRSRRSSPPPSADGQNEMDAATLVLTGGGRAMKRLGALGRDLGEIVDADLARVKRGRDTSDPVHTELAARDLAARLREPDPSFGSHGRIGRAGGESGGGRGTPGEEEGNSGDEVDRAQQEAEQDLERLAQEHAGGIAKIEQALNDATSEDEMKAMREEAQRHADAVREAVRGLPPVGTGSASWTSKGAAARELAEQMARALEQVHAEDAVQSGRSALGALDEAKKMLQRGWVDYGGFHQKRVEEAGRKLETEEKWAERALEQMRGRAAARARKQLEQGGEEEEQLAQRARDLGQKAHEREALPENAIGSIEDAERAARQAAQALEQGDADRGLERQRQAQRSLEAARQQLQGDDDDSRSTTSPEDGDGKEASRAPVNIPNAKEHKGPEEFRKRVVVGLGQPSSGALKDAVRRYAEGLLR